MSRRCSKRLASGYSTIRPNLNDDINDVVRWLRNAESRGTLFKDAPKYIKESKEAVMAIVGKDWTALRYAANDLKRDKEVVMAAMNQSPHAIQYAAESLKADKEIVMTAVQKNGKTLQYAAESLKADKEVVTTAVQQCSYALKHAAESLKADKELFMIVVQEYGWMLKYAAESLKADKEIVMAAFVQQNSNALQYVAQSLKEDREVVMTAIQRNAHALQYAAESLKDDREIVMTAVEKNGYALEYASEAMKEDWEIVMTAIQNGEGALKYAASSLKHDNKMRAFKFCTHYSIYNFHNENFHDAIEAYGIDAFCFEIKGLSPLKELFKKNPLLPCDTILLLYTSGIMKKLKETNLYLFENIIMDQQTFTLRHAIQYGWPWSIIKDVLNINSKFCKEQHVDATENMLGFLDAAIEEKCSLEVLFNLSMNNVDWILKSVYKRKSSEKIKVKNKRRKLN